MIQRPNVVGLILCEQTIKEEGTKNITLVNTFHRRWYDLIPTRPHSFTVFFILTDGLGDVPLRLTISRLDTMEAIYQLSDRVRMNDPLRLTRVMWRVEDLTFPVAGRYEVALFVQEELIAQTVLMILDRGQSDG